jgi:signal transduction histidine kinase/DNA-binding NarL/FixJ family response regulator
MSSPEPAVERPRLLDRQAAASAKRARRRHREVVVIPRLRAVGSLWLLLTVLAHNWLLLPELHGGAVAVFGAAQISYLFLSSWLLNRYYREEARFDLGSVFLATDVIVFVSALYVSGGERSWLLPLLCVRVADQMVTSRRRVLAFATWTAALHVLLVLHMAFIEQRAFDLKVELAKALFVYLLNLYLALAAGPSERQRKEAVHATSVAHDLIEQLGERTHQLEHARARAEAASQAKGTFLANISHELRTPMNAVLGMADLLLDERLLPGQRKMVETILSSGRSLLSIVNDVLDLSKIEAGELRVHLTEISLEQLVESVLSPMRVLADSKGLELRLELETDPTHGVRADELRLRQVIFNLIGNAIKFTESGSVTLRVSQTDAEDERVRVRFSVADTGIGMTETAAREVFEAFKQADDSTTRRFGGTGLGLSISKRLVQLMAGELTLQTAPGLGSTFEFELLLERVPLPAAEPTAYTDSAALAAKLHDVAPHVLIAEDTEVNRMLLQKWLERLGFRVTCVANGEEAVAALAAAHQYSVAFMDWHMPVLDGLAATERIRQWEQAQGRPRTPIIGFTASAFTDETERCRKAGMDDVLSKPVVRAELERKLHHALFGAGGTLEPATRTSSTAPRLDMTMLDELQSLGAPQYVASLIEQFRKDTEQRLELLAGAIERADHASVRTLAHALRGSAAGIGAQRLAELATALETHALQQLPADAPTRLLELREEYEQLAVELERITATGAAASRAVSASGRGP